MASNSRLILIFGPNTSVNYNFLRSFYELEQMWLCRSWLPPVTKSLSERSTAENVKSWPSNFSTRSTLTSFGSTKNRLTSEISLINTYRSTYAKRFENKHRLRLPLMSSHMMVSLDLKNTEIFRSVYKWPKILISKILITSIDKRK